jgi:hypothetical protein
MVPYIVMLPPPPEDVDGAPAQAAQSTAQTLSAASKNLDIRPSLHVQSKAPF